ncbi:MAG: carbon-monoxide dehydrogenase large subunit [Chloroflexi bacterium]|nr:MAG: carbon-monoxide dehydrogenase large subunit [Chloroflexota bacterium]
MTTYKVIGHNTARAEGPDKVTGQGKYGIDALLPDTLWCKILRSPFPHARIVSIDTSEALKLPGVKAVITGKDVEGVLTGRSAYKDEPVIAWDRVRYVGDKVAAVAAEDEDTAEQAISLIHVEYEQLAAVLTPEEALLPDSPLLHPDFNSYVGVKPQETPSNIIHQMGRLRGDVEQGYAEADFVIEQTYTTPHSHQAYIEPHASLVWIDPDGHVQLWMASQMGSVGRDELARIFDLPKDQVTANFSYLGGSFGGKVDVAGAHICYVLAKATGRPIKYVMEYTEELIAANPRHPSVMRVKAGVKKDGTITAWQAEILLATGAYAGFAPQGLKGITDIAGPYRIANVKMDIRQLYTNTVPCGFAKAPGNHQGIFAGESHMDLLARAIGMDPLEFRLKNVVHEGEELGSGDNYEAIRAEETLREAASVGGWDGPKAPNVGRGIAIGHHSQAGGGAQAVTTINEDGSIVVEFSSFDPGGGTTTLAKQIVAEELGVPAERVEARPWSNTDRGPLSGVGGSRGARVTTVSTNAAAVDARQKIQRLAAEFWGWPEEQITMENGFLVQGATGEKVSIEDVMARYGGSVSGLGEINEGVSPYTSFGTQIAEVEVDPETGQVKLLSLATVHETGRIINPVAFQGQIEGGVVYGVGESVMEETVYQDGHVVNVSFGDMKIPNMMDIPALKTVVMESEFGDGPYKVRGIGEHSNIMTAAAIANAVEDAIGARVCDLPITSEKVHEALRQKGQ